MAFIEDVADRYIRIVEPAPRCLRHDQGMVGDHEIGRARAADRVLDETAAIMGAGGVDALAPPIREPEDRPLAEQLGKPARDVTPLDVAIPRRGRPAQNQPERDCTAGKARAPHRILEI